MKTIVEKLNELEQAGLQSVELDEGIKEWWGKIKDFTVGLVQRIKNRVIVYFGDGTIMPVIHPACSALIINGGDAGDSTFFVGDAGMGVKGVDPEKVLKDWTKNKKSIFESVEGREPNLNEAKIDLSGKGVYGPDITSERFKFYLKACINRGEKSVPMLIWGAPGIGKTAIVKSVLKECYGKKRLIVKNLAQCQKDDFTLPKFGIETVSGVDKEVVNEIPKVWLPMYKQSGDPRIDAIEDNVANGGTREGEVGEGGVIFFDEIARCAEDVQAVALSLIQDRELVGQKLGSKWTIIAASNRECDDVTSITLSKALANRFQQFNFVPSFDDWKSWASKQKHIFPELLMWLSAETDKKWYSMDPDDETEKVYASPRSWDNACRALAGVAAGAKDDGYDVFDIPEDVLQEILIANVGSAQGTAAATFVKACKDIDVRAVKEVFTNPKKAPNLSKLKNDSPVLNYVTELAINSLDPNKLPDPEALKNYMSWAVTSGNVSSSMNAYMLIQKIWGDKDQGHDFGIWDMMGNPACQEVQPDNWDRYSDTTAVLLKAFPGLDKDLGFDLRP